MGIPNNLHPLKRLASEFKPLNGGDYFRDGKVVHINNLFQRVVQWVRDWFHGGKTACDQRAFVNLCKTHNLKNLTRSMYTSLEQQSLSHLVEIAQQTKWLLKVKAHLMLSGVLQSCQQKKAYPVGDDPRALYEAIFGNELEAFTQKLSERLAAVEGATPPSVQSTLLRAKRWMGVEVSQQRLQGGSIPYGIKATLHQLYGSGVIDEETYLALTVATTSKRSFREHSIDLLEALHPPNKEELLYSLQNNQFSPFYAHLEGRIPKTYAQDLIDSWIREVGVPVAECKSSKALHTALVSHFKNLISGNGTPHSRNAVYYAFAWLEELEKVNPQKTLQELPQLIEKERLFRSLNSHLAEFKNEVLARDIEKINARLAKLGLAHVVPNGKNESIQELLNLISHFYVQSLYHYQAAHGQDWIYSFYYGEFVEKFQAFSTVMHNHKWCGSCHYSQTVHPRTEWPSTLYEKSPLSIPNRIVPVEQHQAVENPRGGSVMICTVSYGSGHNSATSATASYLHQLGIHTHIVDNSLDTFLPDDLLHIFTGKSSGWNNSALFNLVIRNRWYALSNVCTSIAKMPYQVFNIPGAPLVPQFNHSSEFRNQEKRFLRKAMMLRSDVIIAAYQQDLNYIRKIAHLLKIPLISLSTDMSTKAGEVFTAGSQLLENEDFRLAVPYRDEVIKKTAHALREPNLFYSGYPVHPAFLRGYDTGKIKEDLKIEEGCAVALIMSGGEGSYLPYPELLGNDPTIQKKMRLIVIAGKNNDYVKHLQQNFTLGADGIYRGKNPNVTISVGEEQGTTKNPNFPYFLSPSTVAGLYAISDAIITKPGGGSVAQALYMRKKMLFDGAVSAFEWEHFNAEQIARWGFSSTFVTSHELAREIVSAKEAPVDAQKLDPILVSNPIDAITSQVLEALDRSQNKFTNSKN